MSTINLDQVDHAIFSKISDLIEKESKMKVLEEHIDYKFNHELRIDSLSRIRIIVGIERTFNVEITEAAAVEMNSVRDLMEFVKKNQTN